MPNRRVIGVRVTGLDRTHHHRTCIQGYVTSVPLNTATRVVTSVIARSKAESSDSNSTSSTMRSLGTNSRNRRGNTSACSDVLLGTA
jgi:hypothetical protein